MTLKNQGEQLSSKAKAFSVEALLQKSNPPAFQLPVEFKEEKLEEQQFIKNDPQLKVELCHRELWKKFHNLSTEMIITKAGRRMFPTVKIRLHGLQSQSNYIVFLDIISLDDKRYRYVYHSSQWTVAGAGDPPLPRNIYLHPDSPATGQLWMAQGVISFDKLKLTNNRRPIVRGQVSLHSMHKYQPRVHIIKTDDLETPAEEQALNALRTGFNGKYQLQTFTFNETSFITVTAYQNQQITKLKIASNPFAKGFREASKTSFDFRDHYEENRSINFGNFSSMDQLPPPYLTNTTTDTTLFSPHWSLRMPVTFVIPPTTPLLPSTYPSTQFPYNFTTNSSSAVNDLMFFPPNTNFFNHQHQTTVKNEALDLSK